MLKVGDKMPLFAAANQNGEVVESTSLVSKRCVIYFYPRANTPGCTAEACNLRDNHERFVAEGYRVIGISKDSVSAQKRFAERYELPFDLLSDATTDIMQAFGAWGEKKLYGKVSYGTLRKTYIFDEQGVLVKIIEKVDTKNHTNQIL